VIFYVLYGNLLKPGRSVAHLVHVDTSTEAVWVLHTENK
jgi:hypothetical protein